MHTTVANVHDWATRQVGDDPDAVWEFLNAITLGPTEESDWNYWCDPVNVDTFAETGMGGAHFGEFDASDGMRPVVLVTPDTGKTCHTILGESLHEFLCLGCRVGYGLLVELPVQPAQTVQWIEEGRPARGNEGRVLEQLRSEFALTPWSDVGTRLFVLQERYLDELVLPE